MAIPPPTAAFVCCGRRIGCRVKYREDIVDGLENAPRAFQGLLQGRNFGKQVIRVAPDPTV